MIVKLNVQDTFGLLVIKFPCAVRIHYFRIIWCPNSNYFIALSWFLHGGRIYGRCLPTNWPLLTSYWRHCYLVGYLRSLLSGQGVNMSVKYHSNKVIWRYETPQRTNILIKICTNSKYNLHWFYMTYTLLKTTQYHTVNVHLKIFTKNLRITNKWNILTKNLELLYL